MADAPAAAAPYAPPSLGLADLQRVHPLWLRHKPELVEIRDVTTGALSDKERLKKYLPRAAREHDVEYEARVKMTEVVAESMVARDRIIGALFSVKPTRDVGEELQKWSLAVDRRGQSLDHFLESVVMPPAIDLGACHVLVDRPSDGGLPPADLAEQETRGLRWPALAAYTPLEVRNWCFAEDGTLDWVMIVEEGWQVDPNSGRRTPQRTYRRFDRRGWAKWTVTPKRDGEQLPTESWAADGEVSGDDAKKSADQQSLTLSAPTFGEHGSAKANGGRGRVPMVSFIPSPIDELIGRPTIAPAVRLDLRIARLQSDLAWDLYVHAHPYLLLLTSRELATVGVGSNEALKMNPGEDEDAKYLALPSESFQARERAIAEARTDIYRHLGIDPLSIVSDAPAEASGVARAWSFSTSEARHLGRHADRIEDGELQLFTVVAEHAAVEPPKHGAVRWPETFETASPTQLMEDAIAFRQACRSETAQRLVEKRLARAVVGEIDEKTSAEIDAEIDAEPEHAPTVVVAQ